MSSFIFGPPTNAFGGLHRFAKFRWNWWIGFDNMQVLVFCEFGLKRPTHAPFWAGFTLRVFDP